MGKPISQNPLLWGLIGYAVGGGAGSALFALLSVILTIAGYGEAIAGITEEQGIALFSIVGALVGALWISKEVE